MTEENWLLQQGITPIGTRQDRTVTWNRDPSLDVPLDQVPNFNAAVTALRKIPSMFYQLIPHWGTEHVMFFSTIQGSCGAFDVMCKQDFNADFDGWMIYYYQGLCPETIVHEYAHIIDNVGIRGEDFWAYSGIQAPYPPIWNLRDEVNQIFNATGNLMHPVPNTWEDFAVHFAHYVLYNQEMLTKAQSSADVGARYNFFKNRLFPPAPTAKFTYTVEGLIIRLDASASTGAYPLDYEWLTGDGSWYVTRDPVVYHDYSRYGRYPVSLRVTDVNGEGFAETYVNVPRPRR